MCVLSKLKHCKLSIIKQLLLLLVSSLIMLPVSAQNETLKRKDYILVINSYTETSVWSNRLLSLAVGFAGDKPNLAIYAEHMNVLLVNNESAVREFEQTIINEYGEHPPRMLVLLGNSATILLDNLKESWGDIPIVLCAEEDYVGPRQYYIQKKVIPPSKRIPISRLVDSYNLVFLHTNLFVKENVEMMFKIIPEMKEFIFVGDQRYFNQVNDEEIRQVLKAEHPQVNYKFFTPKEMSMNQLLDSLNFIDPHTTGILFSSWFYKRTFAGSTSVVPNGFKMIVTSTAPIFGLSIIDVTGSQTGLVGGYVYDEKPYETALLNVFTEIIIGRQPRTIPFYLPTQGIAAINYPAFIKKGLVLDNCPSNVVFYNKPPTFWEQFRFIISFFLLCIVVLTLFFLNRIRVLRKLRIIQQKEITMMGRYKSLINNMPILYMQEELVTDENGVAVDTIFRNVNTYFENKLFRMDEVLGKKGSDVFSESLPQFLPSLQLALTEKRAITFPYYNQGTDQFFDVVVKGTTEEGVLDIFCLDSTELHKAQRRLNATNQKLVMALDVASIVPWKWDLCSKTILCDINKSIEISTLGNEVDKEQLAMPDAQYFAKVYKEDRKRVMTAYQDLIEGRIAKVKEEYRVITVEGHTHKIEWVEAQAAVETRDKDGKPLTLVGSSLVITNRKELELELITAKDQAEESNRLKSAFLANMSHEIRTPLNAIVGFSGILASTDEEEEKLEYVSIIENNNTLLLQLISDILDLSKIEAGTLEYHYTTFELNTVMRELESTLQLKVKLSTVNLQFVPGLEKCHVKMEKNRLSQLFINLVTNAIKFTTEGSIRFGYELRGNELYFFVSDTGTGIPKEKLDSIFGRFVKLNSFAQGTGLGLSICKTLVDNMDGHIGVESEEGVGSTFWFTLPYEPVAMYEDAKVIDMQPVAVETDKLTILIAEDNESNYRLFESILKNEYRLLHAWDGREAVEMYRQFSPQIILMDINMPVMNGYEATQEIRKCSDKVPIIAITAFAYASDEQRVMESGFDGYMSKPINASQLKIQIKAITQNRFIVL